MGFGETVSPVAAIQAILHDYPYSASILREILQNSDDAKATKQIFVLVKGKDPALIAYNDAQFYDDDWKAIQSIHQSSKKQDTSKIGKYGVGFRACYHITDVPQILSGASFAILDPLHSGGMKLTYDEFVATDHHNHFYFFSDISEPKSFPGTVIRLPLRSSPSELSQRSVHVDELHQMIKEYIAEELNISLLFLDNLRMIEIWETDGTGKTCLATWTKSERISVHQSEDRSFIAYDSMLSNGTTQFSWRIIQTQYSEEEAKSRLGGESVNDIFKKHKLQPDVRLAHPLSSDGYKSGRLFTFLPLPSKTDFPVHIHALFALTSSRQGLRNPNETGIVPGSDNDILIRWNKLLFDHYIPQAWCCLLKSLAEGRSCKDIYSAWPPYLSPITAGDGLYWQNVLSNTFNIAVQSSSAIWPRVSSQDIITFGELKSSLIVAEGNVDLDVLVALDQLGLTLVQLPKDHMRLLDNSMAKLTPGSAHASLMPRGTDISQSFESLSAVQRGILCKYFLSEEDFSHVYGLPLLPTLNGSYISLRDRKTCAHRHVALTSEEAEVFKDLASDAIPLARLDSEVATLMLRRGTSQANVDLLTPQVVIEYLSTETELQRNGFLTKFWSWVSKWHRKHDVMNLLKVDSTLRLIPTSKGLQPVSSPVFDMPPDTDNGPLFEKLGLVFISPVLPSSVTQFLNTHRVIKDTSDMNDFLGAIDFDALSSLSLSNNEAESVFTHVATHYRSLLHSNPSKLKKAPIFPVLVPDVDAHGEKLSNTSVTWCSIDDLTIEGISPMRLVPAIKPVHFLDKASIKDPSCSLLKSLQIHLLKDENILLLTLHHFPSLSKSLQAAFISYIEVNDSLNRLSKQVRLALGQSKFISTSDGTLQSPEDVIDPESQLRSIFPPPCKNFRIPKYEDDYDHKIFNSLRALKLTKTILSSNMTRERISYISSNSTSPQAMEIARSLVFLMNDPNFICSGISIDPDMRWLPTRVGLITLKHCIDSGRRDTNLFDEVLTSLDEPGTVSTSFKALMGWDKLLPLDVLTKQLSRVLDQPDSETRYCKVHEIIRELASRDLSSTDIGSLGEIVAKRPWVPTKSGTLVPHSRAVFTGVPDSSCFREIGFSKSERQIYQFLSRMGCHEQPTAAAIINELNALRIADRTDVHQAVQLLEMLPDSTTDQDRKLLLVPTRTGELVSLVASVYYYKGSGIVSEADEKTHIAHHLVSEKLASKIKLRPLGASDDIDLGEKPITTIRNTLRQYDPEQFFTEFIANASDAKAKRFSILLDDHEGPTNNLVSEGLAAFQSASLVVHNDGVFTREDFRGILQTGIGGKKGKSGVIGHFGLGALSMFHFTELAMIVSGKHVLFMSPSKRNLSFCGKHSILFDLQEVKRLYADHLEPLNGLFGFDVKSDGPYEGTLFRLPLRNESHQNDDSVLTTPWDINVLQDMFLRQFKDLAYKSLLFTALSHIDISKRQNSRVEELRSIHSDRESDNYPVCESFKSETVKFISTAQKHPQWLVISMEADIPQDYRDKLAKKYDMHYLPVRIAAALDSARISDTKYNLFCSLPLPVTTPLPAHISAPLILEQERRNIRLDSDGLGIESRYNQWLLSSEVPRLYLYLLERLLRIQGTNVPWWPVIQSHNPGVASRIFMDAFYSFEVLGESARHIFASKYVSDVVLSPKEVILFSEEAYIGYKQTLTKVFSITRPPNVAEVPKQLFECIAKAGLRFVDAVFVKSLLENLDQPDRLNMDEIKILISYLSREKASLDGLSLLPLEDGSYAKIQSKSQSIKTYYVFESALFQPPLAYSNKLFKRDRFVHKEFKAYDDLLGKDYNVSLLLEAGVVELVEESIKPAHEFSGDEVYGASVFALWDAGLKITPKRLSHLPLVPTLRQSHFISLEKVDDPSVIVVQSQESSHEKFDYGILQSLGITIIVRKRLPEALHGTIKKKKDDTYHSFLDYLQENQTEGLAAIQRLAPDDHQKLGQWIRLKFSCTYSDKAGVACRLPVWPVQQRNKRETRLVSLNEAIVLPPMMPSGTLVPFTDQPLVDWTWDMSKVKKEGCNAKCITELLTISQGTLLRGTTDRKTYKRLLECLLKFDDISNGYTLLAPNEGGVLTPVDELFERDELFMSAFKAQSRRLLSSDFQDLDGALAKHGLNQKCQLDLQMFIECAKAFDADRERSKSVRSETLYTHFNNLPLVHWRDADRCHQLDKLKFIPRANSPREGYDGIDTGEYMAELSSILSPSEIVLPEYEPICWSQRGRPNSPPNPTLCGTYKSLGQPSGREVVEHLKVLAEIGQRYGRCSALLSDLKATYKWLNDHVSEIEDDILQENSNLLFLNVDDPNSDKWVWHSALNIVMDLQDVRDLHDVKDFLRNYIDLLKAAGIRKIHNVVATPVVATDKTTFFREQFSEMRQRGCDVNVIFNAKDTQYNILPAHRTWLSVNSTHFRVLFSDAAGFQEAHVLGFGESVTIKVEDHSSLCVKEVIDWIYTGELPDSIKVNGSDDEESGTRKLRLALDMLLLAHYWQVTELHEHMQKNFINSFLNPYTVKTIRDYATKTEANELLEACQEFEDYNQEIINEVPKDTGV
ncbi:hypothetical protein AX15_007571 [Amanita polypyramis BW_CC]|nr:hypothetical protein AX15_007571 [Amanita polypyramis BW_CC]